MFASREAFRSLPTAIVVLAWGCSSLLGFDDVGFDDSDGGSQAGAAGSTGGSAGEAGASGGAAGSGGTNAAGMSGTGGTSQAGAAGSGGSSLPPFECDLPSATPTLEPEVWTHPASPKAGEAVTLVVWSQNTEPSHAPQLVGEITHRDGTRQVTDYGMVGGGNATYYVTFAALAEGENCVVLKNGDNVEVAYKVDAPSPAPGIPRGNGPWKVRVNHQWRCDEQPTYGNLLHVRVSDENGDPVEGAAIRIRWTDDTVFPVKPDDSAMTWEDSAHPKTMTTGTDGRAELNTPWGEGVRSPIDAKPKLVVFLLSVDGGASDTATEITTGLWEADASGCNYCSTYGVNVYGHWSHTVEFQRDPGATAVCDVPIDHEGQQSCSHAHFFHDPDRPSCLPIAP